MGRVRLFMPQLSDLRANRDGSVFSRCIAWTRTLEYARRRDEARRAIAAWLGSVNRPCVSVSGGKDSTLLLELVREADPSVPAVRADPPNPLRDRAEHVAALQRAAGGLWHVVPYDWDVQGVICGTVLYPAGLKIRVLQAFHRQQGHTGLAVGVRAGESRSRAIHVARRGLLYTRKDGMVVCQPLSRWSAEMVLGALLRSDRLPLNPVYSRLSAAPQSLEHLREGTWRPITPTQRIWIATHYPEVLADFDRLRAVIGYRQSAWAIPGAEYASIEPSIQRPAPPSRLNR
jgi:3'-phosphoadenosine 5'-phosphosulfate sulfotransferase (PAPS reductase)/FAD synthetase